MAAIVWGDVTAVATTLTSVNVTAQTFYLAHVNTMAGIPEQLDGEDGPTTRLARIYLAAHMGAFNGAKGNKPGSIASESAGGLSKSYAAGLMTDQALSLTVWGRMYMMLATSSMAGFPLVGGR